ncbi:DUF3180 domain-containing protein [Amnibacterium flavum]|uniref:DUF3180 domain-containing protein n=1 Tax=Amnibacterium flavum TaxID=2173173 RepID=A0A2V1HRP3_9MICO|nr:DUF3180 domain-containing protein [Amnibacterium flavum]PVZ95218.1 DUF3180 domain-containing protein [Amnibacterium flavum]
MKTTTPGFPLVLAGAGAVLAYLLEVGLVAAGQASFIPPYSLALSLAAIGAIELALGWPIRQTLRGTRLQRLDPFRAMRVVLLAKASILVGALLGGAALGALIHLVGRPVIASGNDIVQAVLSVAAAAFAIIAGIIVEQWCKIPPSDPDETAFEQQGQ